MNALFYIRYFWEKLGLGYDSSVKYGVWGAFIRNRGPRLQACRWHRHLVGRASRDGETIGRCLGGSVKKVAEGAQNNWWEPQVLLKHVVSKGSEGTVPKISNEDSLKQWDIFKATYNRRRVNPSNKEEEKGHVLQHDTPSKNKSTEVLTSDKFFDASTRQ